MSDGASHPTTRARSRLSPAAMRAFLAFVVLAIIVWIAIGVGANARAPGAVGLAATIFGGVLAALLTVTIGGWIALKLNALHTAQPLASPPEGVDPEIAAALADLEIAQAPGMRLMAERAAWRAPICAAAGAGLWSLAVMFGAAGGVMDFSVVLAGAGVLGLVWARYQAAQELEAVYLANGVGGFARRIAGLSWRDTTSIDLARLRSENVLPSRGELRKDGELVGMIHGVSVRIAPVTVEKADDSTGPGAGAFTGFVIELDGAIHPAASMQDLTARDPRVLVRVGMLASLPRLGAPRAAASGSRVSIAVPETGKPYLFAPPQRLGAAAAAPRLERFRGMLETVAGIAEIFAERPTSQG